MPDNSKINFEAPNRKYKCLTWNIEGFSRSKYKLLNFVNIYQPDLIFLSEPMLYQCDLEHEMALFSHQYMAVLSSDDLFDNELPMLRQRAKGGTMVLWKIELQQNIKPLPLMSPSFLPVLFTPQNLKPSIHISIYLPTSGKEDDFVAAITDLKNFIEEIRLMYPDAHLFIRGDANVNENHRTRSSVLKSFCSQLHLCRLPIGHSTDHHFIGDGISDSELDVLLTSQSAKKSIK